MAEILSVFAWYVGINMLIPAFAGLLAALVSSKLLVIRDRAYVPALSACFGHFVWILAGSVVLGFSETLLDLLLMVILIIWLWVRPGSWSGGAIVLFSLIALADGLVSLPGHPIGDTTNKGLVANIGLRLFVIAALVEVWWRQYRSPASERTAHEADSGKSP